MKMADKNIKDEILAKLKRLWKRYPDMRLGQLLENFVFIEGQRGDKTSVKLFYQEDEDTLVMIKKELKRRR